MIPLNSSSVYNLEILNVKDIYSKHSSRNKCPIPLRTKCPRECPIPFRLKNVVLKIWFFQKLSLSIKVIWFFPPMGHWQSVKSYFCFSSTFQHWRQLKWSSHIFSFSFGQMILTCLLTEFIFRQLVLSSNIFLEGERAALLYSYIYWF